MYNSPHETESLPRVLPGKLLTLDAQCRKDRGTSACFKDDRVCSQLFCFDAGSGYCVSYRPAAEGSRCGDSQVWNTNIQMRMLYNHLKIYHKLHIVQIYSFLDVFKWKMCIRTWKRGRLRWIWIFTAFRISKWGQIDRNSQWKKV